ncbi:hypothetical protein [Croceibacter atlanticus]|jgi:hypothetical protein|uniref:hypothetical protein n=1 Tax=Croceibacter atlanticus TaxID=313588 RepID=UPI002491A1D2|nr:hypothetical protein [Croceibacter atlanticus]
MAKKVISVSHQMKGILDDDYTLYDDGSVLHFYDKHTYPGGQNIKKEFAVDNLSAKVKQGLYDAASADNKELVGKILKLT